MEVINARSNAVLQAAPAMCSGKLLFALWLPAAVMKRRVRFALLILSQAALRTMAKRVPMKVL
jgi:hypothetical protein